MVSPSGQAPPSCTRRNIYSVRPQTLAPGEWCLSFAEQIVPKLRRRHAIDGRPRMGRQNYRMPFSRYSIGRIFHLIRHPASSRDLPLRPSPPSPIRTCCFFASFKILAMPSAATILRGCQSPRAPLSFAGFPVILIGRFWFRVIAEGSTMGWESLASLRIRSLPNR
jgi:hypothetical protein